MINRETIIGQGPAIKVSCQECTDYLEGQEWVLFNYHGQITKELLDDADHNAETHDHEYKGKHAITIYEFRV